MKNKGYAKFISFLFVGGGEGANKVHYGRCASGVYLLIELFYIGMPVARTRGRGDVRSRDYQNFSDA